MSETPITDAAAVLVSINDDPDQPHPKGPYVPREVSEKLERENAALREDKERLDWLDADCEVIILTAKDGYELIGHNAFFAVEQKGTLREAIDAARKEAKT